MPDIKTWDVVKGTVKTIDKPATAAQRMKDAYIRTKRKAENSVYSAEDSPSEYAADRISDGTESVLHETGRQLHRHGQKAVSSAKENISKAKSHFQRERSIDPLKKEINGRSSKGAIKTADHSKNGIKQAAKGTSKTAQRSVKTAEKTAKITIKTSQQAAKSAQRTAQAAAKATVAALKAAVRATVSAVKAIIAATKALISALAAGGWVAVVVVIVICLIGLIVGSCFGIFFSGEDTGTGQTMRAAVREINQDYEQKLEEIESGTRHDVLEMSGSRAVWPEVLAVYAVKTTTDPDNAQEVASMDDSKKALLKDIFWQMNEISSRMETSADTVVTETDDGDGHIIQTTTTTNRTTLYITVSHKTADEMADHFHFNADQRKQLAELLAEGNRSMWSAVLYGIGTGDGEIVTVALSQLGNVGGQPYWSWYGFGSRVEWCACFVSWCANECGYIDAGVIPKFAGCGNGVQWFKDRGLWQDRNYEPRPGDIIFFDWNDEYGQDGDSDHVGIVEKVEGSVVYTVEGNSGDMCQENQYTVGYYEILGYGTPAY
ncbi:CHAP domain-containing protein [Acutalibacter muris]|uniref:CHAP domain-containing protein n=1 Tax=Acutalibacter muris TaxID=1796620 RepID=UPI001C3EC7E1|nr:CHAP domain-containing protein [Acutalibacter muris]